MKILPRLQPRIHALLNPPQRTVEAELAVGRARVLSGWQGMVHDGHEMVCWAGDPARCDGDAQDRLLVQDSAHLVGIFLAADGLDEQLAEELAVVDEEVVALGEAAEYDGCWGTLVGWIDIGMIFQWIGGWLF